MQQQTLKEHNLSRFALAQREISFDQRELSKTELEVRTAVGTHVVCVN